MRPAGFTPSISTMDVPRPDVARKKKKRRIMIVAGSVLGLILVTVLFSRLKPAVPSVDRSTVWVDTVKRGPMLRQVRGLGTLVPEDIRWIAANTEGRVEKIVVRPGAQVTNRTRCSLELTSPELEQAAHDAELQAKAAEAELTTLRATLQRELVATGIDFRASPLGVRASQDGVPRPTTSLQKNGLIADLAIQDLESQSRTSWRIAMRLRASGSSFRRDSIEPQLAAKQAAVDQLKATGEIEAEPSRSICMCAPE